MILTTGLVERSGSKCELCGTADDISAQIVAPKTGADDDEYIVICGTCQAQSDGTADIEADRWRCLNDSMWNPNPAVQVSSYRMLQKLSTEDWAQDLITMMYMDEDTTEWANATILGGVIHKDSNGAVLNHGDTVTLIKDLVVKGANFTAKRGTAVRRISLVTDNEEHIQGKINGQNIIILTQFVKKS